jgi:hypothetical protein
MAAALVPDDLWDVIEPLLPLPKHKPQGGRPRLPDRACLRGYSVCTSQWNSLGDVAEGVGLWFGHDLLEAHARLAAGRHLAIDSLCAVGLALSFQSDRLVPSCRG